MTGDRAAWIERRYGVRVRIVRGLEERVLVVHKKALVLVDDGLSCDDWEWVTDYLARQGRTGP